MDLFGSKLIRKRPKPSTVVMPNCGDRHLELTQRSSYRHVSTFTDAVAIYAVAIGMRYQLVAMRALANASKLSSMLFR